MADAMPLVYTRGPQDADPALAANGQAPPLVLLLHGSGSNEQDLLSLAPHMSQACGHGGKGGGAVVASLRAPYDQLGGYAWFHGNSAAPPLVAINEQIAASTDKVIEFLEKAPSALGTDPARAYLFGFSQGATIGWTAMLSQWPRPSLLAGVALISGRAMPELARPETTLGARAAGMTGAAGAGLADRLKVRVLCSHGESDMCTPIAMGRDSQALGKGVGLSVEYYEHKGGHGLPHDVMQWVLQNLASAVEVDTQLQ